MKKYLILLLVLCLTLWGCQAEPQLSEDTTSPTEQKYYLLIPLDQRAYEDMLSGDMAISEDALLAKVQVSDGTYSFLQTVPGTAYEETAADEPGAKFLGTVRPSENRTLKYYKSDSGYYFVETVCKTRSCYASDGTLLWEMTVQAAFKCENQTVTCSDVSGQVRIGDTDSWYVISESTAMEGSTGSYTVTFGRETLGITTSTQSYTLQLTGESAGVFS